MYLRNLDLKTWPEIQKMDPKTFFNNLSVQLVYTTAHDKSHEAVCEEWRKYIEGIVFETGVRTMLRETPFYEDNSKVIYELLKRWKEEGASYVAGVALPEPHNPYHVLMLAAHRWWSEVADEDGFKPGSDFFPKIKKEFSVSFREDLLKKYTELSKGVDTWMELIPIGKEIFTRTYEDITKESQMTPEDFVKELKNPWSPTTKTLRKFAKTMFEQRDAKLEQFAEAYMAGFLVRFWTKGSDNCPVMLSFSFDRAFDMEEHRHSSFEQFIWDSIQDKRAAANFVPLMVFYIRACFDMGYYTVEDVQKHAETPNVLQDAVAKF